MGNIKSVLSRFNAICMKYIIEDIEDVLNKVFYLRKEELNKIHMHDKTRAFAVAGEDLIFNYKNDVLDILKQKKEQPRECEACKDKTKIGHTCV